MQLLSLRDDVLEAILARSSMFQVCRIWAVTSMKMHEMATQHLMSVAQWKRRTHADFPFEVLLFILLARQ